MADATNGAHYIVDSLVEAGTGMVVSNPGTSEMHLVAALAKEPRIRSVLGLSETVVTGAADGWARVTRRAAATLLHLGPGLANGWSNLHNARRAGSPVLNLVGDHSVAHRALDAPLTSDIWSLAGALGPTFQPSSPSEMARDLSMAHHLTRTAPGQVATVIVPADLAWSEPPQDAADVAPSMGAAPMLDEADVAACAQSLRRSGYRAMLLRGWSASSRALEVAAAIAAAVGADLLVDTFLPVLDHGMGTPVARRLPYLGQPARALLSEYEGLLCVGGAAPVPFFDYPDQPPSLLPPGCEVSLLADQRQDPLTALLALADELGVDPSTQAVERWPAATDPPAISTSAISPRSIAESIAAVLTEGDIVVDESISSSGSMLRAAAASPPHQWMHLTGGAIGQGLPLATGAALAAADRRVIAVIGDGSAMYSMPALWTMARERLNVTVVICTNRSYHILKDEWTRTGAADVGTGTPAVFDLTNPNLGASEIASGFGVAAATAYDSAALHKALAGSVATPGPFLIDAVFDA